MEEKIKEIVALFLRIPAGDIGVATPVDRRALKSSIMLHRMYARLAEEGFVYRDYASIKVFGHLLAAPEAGGEKVVVENEAGSPHPALSDGSEPIAMGIDIESIDNLPRVTDFRREEFYKMNFTPQEIAYCILQADPYSSFAGLFAAKEALVKADGALRERAFHQIGIGHTPEGRPVYPGFTLSIAHSNGTAVAVAARGGNNIVVAQPLSAPTVNAADRSGTMGLRLGWLAVLLAVAALIIVLLRL